MNELIERIDSIVSAYTEGGKISSSMSVIKIMTDCKAALSQQEQESALAQSTINTQHRLMVTAEQRGAAKAIEELSQEAEPVTYQCRMRPCWATPPAWSTWEACSKGTFEDYKRVPINSDWEFESRALYEHSPLPRPVASSQDVEEFIAEKQRHNSSLNHNAIHADDLRTWMAGHARVPVDVLETILEVVRGQLNEAYQNAMPVCCGQPGQECCGNPVAEWNPSDIELMDSLGPVEKTISAMLTASKERTE